MPVTPEIRVQREDFDIGAEIEGLRKTGADIGAIVAFTGLCRDEKGVLSALELEHYPGMAEAEIRRIAESTIERFSLDGLTVIHRHGTIKPGENIVLVVCSSAHRAAAFDGANHLMDFLKTRAPFWKKEHHADGSAGEWVEAKDDDDAAAARWEE